MPLLDMNTGHEVKSIMDDEHEPTEAEVLAERARIAEEGRQAAAKLAARAEKQLPLTRRDLVLVAQWLRAESLAFTVAHVAKRAVLRNDAAPDSLASDDPLAEPLRKYIADHGDGKSLRYAGAWKSGTSYGLGAICTSKNGLWHANRPTMLEPGGNDSWTLILRVPREYRPPKSEREAQRTHTQR